MDDNNIKEQKQLSKRDTYLIIGGIFLFLVFLTILSDGCQNKPNDNVYTETDYYQDHPNTDKSWEQWQNEQSDYQEIKEEQERRERIENGTYGK